MWNIKQSSNYSAESQLVIYLGTLSKMEYGLCEKLIFKAQYKNNLVK